MNIAEAILCKYPNASPTDDFNVIDHNDGTGQQITMWNIKDSTGAIVPQPSISDLESWWFSFYQQQKKAELEQKCNQAISSGFQSSALGTVHTYPSHDKAQENFNTEMHRFLIDTSYILCKFFTEDAGWLEHTRDQFFQVFKDGHDFGNTQWEKFFELEAKVSALTYPINTIEDINSIKW